MHQAILLQQMHYWLKRSSHYIDGRHWIYNSYKAWSAQMPYLTRRQVELAVKSLEKQDLILTANYNRMRYDKTRWYAINYDAVFALGIEERDRVTSTSDEDGTCM